MRLTRAHEMPGTVVRAVAAVDTVGAEALPRTAVALDAPLIPTLGPLQRPIHRTPPWAGSACPTRRRRKGPRGACLPWGSTCRRRCRPIAGGLSHPPRCPAPRASLPTSRAAEAGCACRGSGGGAPGPPRPTALGAGTCPSRSRTPPASCWVGRRRVTPCGALFRRPPSEPDVPLSRHPAL